MASIYCLFKRVTCEGTPRNVLVAWWSKKPEPKVLTLLFPSIGTTKVEHLLEGEEIWYSMHRYKMENILEGEVQENKYLTNPQNVLS